MYTIRDILVAVVTVAWAIAIPFFVLILLDTEDKNGK